MQRTIPALLATIVLVAAACSSDGGASPSAGTSAAPASEAPSSGEPTASVTGFDPSAISGTARLAGWQSSDAEAAALTDTITAFEAAYPNITVDYQVVPGDYPTVMATDFSARDVPDLFYVDASYAQPWTEQGFLEPLDEYIAASGFDTSTFFPGYLSVFTGEDGKIYGLPKDGNTIGMAYNSSLVTTPPATLDDLRTAAEGLVGSGDLSAPMCLNPGLDRGLAFLYAEGGALLTEDNAASAIDTPESTAAVQWYLDLFKDGLAKTASDMGDGWCGDSLGTGHAAIAFEGGWLDPAMTSTYPDTAYAWAPMPTGSSGQPVTISYTAAYAIGADSQNKDQAWVLLQYLAGVEGMTKWTEGGVALPSRSDVPTPAGKDVLVDQAEVAEPGSGFMPDYADVQKAFQDAFTAEIQNGTYDATAVVSATKTAIDAALQ
jgi:multiple sugar transport system substrate-binding protein